MLKKLVPILLLASVGLEHLWSQLVPLLIFGVLAVGLASLRFRKVQR